MANNPKLLGGMIGLGAVAATILKLLISKGLLTPDEVLTALEQGEETFAAMAQRNPAIEKTFRSIRDFLLASTQKEPPSSGP